MWITNSPIADVFVVWTKDDAGEIRGFVLETGWDGLTAPAIHGKVGLRASITGEVVMDNVFVPEENAFPEVRGLKAPPPASTWSATASVGARSALPRPAGIPPATTRWTASSSAARWRRTS